jgi:hypothetical protein
MKLVLQTTDSAKSNPKPGGNGPAAVPVKIIEGLPT